MLCLKHFGVEFTAKITIVLKILVIPPTSYCSVTVSWLSPSSFHFSNLHFPNLLLSYLTILGMGHGLTLLINSFIKLTSVKPYKEIMSMSSF